MTEDRRITKTKTAIKEAFISIIKKKSAPKITVTEIAKQANIDRKTFYLHYDSIEDLVNEFYQELTSNLLLILEKNDFFDRTFDISSLFESLNLLIEQDIELYRHIVKMPSFFPFWEEIKNIV
ncbi:MAG: TetR/AcrR family transcriptional regulator, partial [Sedimentibacter sp.]